MTLQEMKTLYDKADELKEEIEYLKSLAGEEGLSEKGQKKLARLKAERRATLETATGATLAHVEQKKK